MLRTIIMRWLNDNYFVNRIRIKGQIESITHTFKEISEFVRLEKSIIIKRDLGVLVQGSFEVIEFE